MPSSARVTRRGSTRWPIVVGVAVLTAASGVLGASAAQATVDPSSGGCPNGYLATSANGTSVGVLVPTGSSGPQGGPGRSTSSAPRYNELVGTGCYQRSGSTATMRFSWSSVGEIYSGTFVYQMYDCTVPGVTRERTRNIGYPTGTKATAGSEQAAVALDPSHRYRMRIEGEGAYRRAVDGQGGVIGYRDPHPPRGVPAWFAETTCA